MRDIIFVPAYFPVPHNRASNIPQARTDIRARNNRRHCAVRCGRRGPRLINVNCRIVRNQFATRVDANSQLALAVFPGFVERFGTSTYRGTACLYYFTDYVPQISGRHAISRVTSPRPLSPTNVASLVASSFAREWSARSRSTGINQCSVQKLI